MTPNGVKGLVVQGIDARNEERWMFQDLIIVFAYLVSILYNIFYSIVK